MLKKFSLLLFGAFVFAACQPQVKPESNLNLSPTPQTETPTATVTAAPTIDDTQTLLNLKPNQKMFAILKTSLGSIKVQLFPDKAPKTVANFVGLAEGTKDWTDPKTGAKQTGKSLYAGTIFHRIIKGFMIQGGDPLGTGTGGPGYKFEDEQTGESYTRGTIAMANSGPNTNGSQFFIMHADYPLPPNYTIFGRIGADDKASLATLDKIANVPVADNGMGEASKPKETVTLLSVTIERQ